MFDFRYHIVSIIAVFFALALGLLVGGSVAERGIVEKQRQVAFDKLIGSIRSDIEKLQKDNRALKNENQVHNKFAEQAYPALIDGKLLLKNFLILASGDGSRGIGNDIKKVISDAGGNAFEIRYVGVKNISSADVALLLPGVSLASTDSSQIDPILRNKLYSQLIASLDAQFLKTLSEKKIIELNGAPSAPISGVCLNYRPQDAGNAFSSEDAAVIEIFKKAGKPIVAVDHTSSKQSFLSALKSLDISTVDNFEKTIGKISFIYSLAGQPGHYGELPQAESLTPDLSLDALK